MPSREYCGEGPANRRVGIAVHRLAPTPAFMITPTFQPRGTRLTPCRVPVDGRLGHRMGVSTVWGGSDRAGRCRMGAGAVPGRDPPVRTELVRESARTRVTRLFLPGRTVG